MKTVFLLMAEYNSPTIPLDAGKCVQEIDDFLELQDFLSDKKRVEDARAELEFLIASIPAQPSYPPKIKHSSKHPLYSTWRGIKNRCQNPRQRSYENYGGRGISICEAWDASFSQFVADMGNKPSVEYSIERIDNDGNYSPDNCKWAKLSEQNRNRRRVRDLHSENVRLRAELAQIKSDQGK